MLYVVENGETVNSVEDLKGKTIVTTGKGTTPEYVLRYILTENGVEPRNNDVTLDFYSEATEALAQLQAGTSTIAMLAPALCDQRTGSGRRPARCPGYERRVGKKLLAPSW